MTLQRLWIRRNSHNIQYELKRFLKVKHRSESPPKPSTQVLDQAYKALGKVMTELLFTKKENKGLRAELEKKEAKATSIK